MQTVSLRRLEGRALWIALAGCALLAVALLVWIGTREGAPPPAPDAALASDRPDATPVAAAGPAASAAQPAPAPSDLPHTDLPLRLLATVVRENRTLSLATVEDLERTQHQVLAEGQSFRGFPDATLLEIERGRVILDNDGVREQLVIDRSAPVAYEGYGASPEQREYRREMARRIRGIQEAGTDYLDRGERTGLLAEGEVSAVYVDGELIGVQIDDVREGGVYDRFGIRNGDVITSINGVGLGAPTAMGQVLTDLAVADELQVELERGEVISVPTDELIGMLAELE
jgi:type II secretion system protein C